MNIYSTMSVLTPARSFPSIMTSLSVIIHSKTQLCPPNTSEFARNGSGLTKIGLSSTSQKYIFHNVHFDLSRSFYTRMTSLSSIIHSKTQLYPTTTSDFAGNGPGLTKICLPSKSQEYISYNVHFEPSTVISLDNDLSLIHNPLEDPGALPHNHL
jgi:hypothetical protein